MLVTRRGPGATAYELGERSFAFEHNTNMHTGEECVSEMISFKLSVVVRAFCG